MKRVLALSILLISILIGCGQSGSGELVGVGQSGVFFEPDPFGMLFIKSGSFEMGPNDQDLTFGNTTQTKTVSLRSLWIS